MSGLENLRMTHPSISNGGPYLFQTAQLETDVEKASTFVSEVVDTSPALYKAPKESTAEGVPRDS